MEQLKCGRPPQGRIRHHRSFVGGLGAFAFVTLHLLGVTAAFASPQGGCGKPSVNLKARTGFEGIARKLRVHETVRILAIGSSSTEGIGATTAALAYPPLLETDLEAAWNENVTVVNAGIGGETASQTIERLETALDGERFDLVIWQVGTNDAIRGVGEEPFRALVERGIVAARRAGTDLLLLDQQFYPAIPDLDRYERFVSTLATLGNERGVSVFSRYAMMKGWAAEWTESLRAMLARDGFHMGDKGYACLASGIARELRIAVGLPAASRNGPDAVISASAK